LPVEHPTHGESEPEQEWLKAPLTIHNFEDKRRLRRVMVPETLISLTSFNLS